MTLTLTALAGIPNIRPGDDLAQIIHAALMQMEMKLEDGDILVLAQKIVSKAEGRFVDLATITPTREALDLAARTDKDPRLAQLMLRESRQVLRTRSGTAIVEHRLGFICANAGIDHSNVLGEAGAGKDWVLLLPDDPGLSARRIRDSLEKQSGRRLGTLIIDSHGRAWRIGTVGVAIGMSGLPAVVDERGWKDLFGYTLQVTVVGVADELAAAASLLMGQAAEGTPVIHVRGFPYPLGEGTLTDLLRPRDQDLFR